MKKLSILALALTAGTLYAQSPELALDARIQLFGEMAQPVNITVVSGAPGIQDRPDNQTGIGIRFMGEIASAPGFYYEVGGKLDASSNFTFNGASGPGNTLDLTDVKLTSSYWSLGAAYMIRPVEMLTLGVHLEGRGEALTASGQVWQNLGGAGTTSLGTVSASTTYLRPWVRLSADISFPMGNLRPYFGVDGSVAITRTEQTAFMSLNLMDNRTLRALAPNAAVAFYIGTRF